MVEIQGQNLNTPLQVSKNSKVQNPIELEANNPSSDSALDKKSSTEELSYELANNHKQEIKDDKPQVNLAKHKSSNAIQEFFKNGPQWFQNFRNYFVMGLNTIGITLNSVSVIASNSNIMPKPVAEYLDKAAEWYSRYVISLGFGWNGIESLVGKRPIEALARFLPAAGFMALPFYNFNLSTGISSTMSYIFDKVISRNGDKQPGIGSAMENTKGTIKHTLDIFKDFFNPKSKETLVEKFGIAGLGLGTLGGLLFASHERDSLAARFFGNLRNLGGLVADYELVFNKDTTWRSAHKRTVGLTCSTASILNIIARWVNPDVGRILNHLSIAADDFGLTYWAQMSKKDNDEASGRNADEMQENSKLKLQEIFSKIQNTDKTTNKDLHLAIAA
jgi:hypothetical protein